MREQLKQWGALAMIVVASFVFVTAFGSPLTNSRPIIPALVPVFGIPFGVAFALLQCAYCGIYSIHKGLLVLPVVWVVAVLLVFLLFGTGIEPDPSAMARPARAVTGAACASALVLGFAVRHGKL